MPTKKELEGKVIHYERLLDAMQGFVFFVQDEEGFLRRWYPPEKRTPISK